MLRIGTFIQTVSTLALIFFPLGISAQEPQLSRGTEDLDILTPALGSSLDRHDPAAVDILLNFIKLTAGDSWQVLHAQGTIAYGADENIKPEPVDLVVANDGKTRLDVTTTEGVASTRFDGLGGGLQLPHELPRYLPPHDALLGFATFSGVLAHSKPEFGASVIDQGLVNVDGTSLRRVTLIRMASPHSHGDPKRDFSATDLYFSPETGMMMKSTDLVHSLDSSPAVYLRVITYSDYRPIDGMTVPFQLRETVNGQPAWTLMLTSAENSSTPSDHTYFVF